MGENDHWSFCFYLPVTVRACSNGITVIVYWLMVKESDDSVTTHPALYLYVSALLDPEHA